MQHKQNPLGVHALVWTGGTSTDDIALAIKQTQASGFDLLELSLHDMDRLDTGAARAALEQAGLQVACSRGLAFDADVSSDDPEVVAAGEAILQTSLDVTASLGGQVLTGALYSALGKYGHRLTDGGRANSYGCSVSSHRRPSGVVSRSGWRSATATRRTS